MPNWSIFNITQIELDKIVVEWHHHPPVTSPLELSAYAVVCTPTDGKLGPTLTTVRGNINRTEVHRFRRGTNYSVEIVALIYNNQTEEITLEKSQSEGMESDEGGKTILFLSVLCTCIGRVILLVGANFQFLYINTSVVEAARHYSEGNTIRACASAVGSAKGSIFCSYKL